MTMIFIKVAKVELFSPGPVNHQYITNTGH